MKYITFILGRHITYLSKPRIEYPIHTVHFPDTHTHNLFPARAVNNWVLLFGNNSYGSNSTFEAGFQISITI